MSSLSWSSTRLPRLDEEPTEVSSFHPAYCRLHGVVVQGFSLANRSGVYEMKRLEDPTRRLCTYTPRERSAGRRRYADREVPENRVAV